MFNCSVSYVLNECGESKVMKFVLITLAIMFVGNIKKVVG